MVMFILQLFITVFGIILLACSLIGIGIGLTKLINLNFHESEKPFVFFWIGFPLVILVLQIIHLFVPLTIYTGGLIFGAGLLIFVLFLCKHISGISFKKVHILYFAILFGLIFYVAYLSLFPPFLWDGDLYHFSTLRWFNEYPIVLGLGNLHDRLAFNQSFFLFVAAANLYPVFNHGYYLSNSLLVVVLIAEILSVFFRIIKSSKKSPVILQNVFPVLFTFPIIYMLVYANLSSPSPDIASTTLQMVIFIYFVREIAESRRSTYSDSRSFIVLLLASVLITIKLSNWAFAGSIIVIVLIRKIIFYIHERNKIISSLIKLLILPSILVLSWCVRSFFLSGCIGYPTSVGCFDVAWAIPKENVEITRNWILSWGRWQNQPYQVVLESWDWITPWFENIKMFYGFDIIYPFVFSIILLVVSGILVVHSRKNGMKLTTNKFYWIPIPVILAITAWFFTAPDPRFANGLFWLLPVAMVILLFNVLESQYGVAYNKLWFVLSAVLLSANICVNFIAYPTEIVRGYFPTFTYPTQYELERKTTNSGLVVWIPVGGEKCGSKELLCTPNYDKNLELIGPDIRFGFKINLQEVE